jgi:hypothetical protein
LISEDNNVTIDVLRNLEKLYECPYSTWNFIRIYNPYIKINSLTILSRGNPIHIFLFTIKGQGVTVLNQLCSIEGKYIDFAVSIFFSKYNIKSVSFLNIYTSSLKDVRRPYVKINSHKNIVIDLPVSSDEFYKRLGKPTRRHIRQYYRKLEKHFPTSKFYVESNIELKESIVRQIVAFNRLRMAEKGFKCYVTREVENNLCSFSKINGLIGVITINDQVVAGTVFSFVGTNAYLDMISHDNRYDRYNIGTICLTNTIKYCIEHEKKSLHMLYGTSGYKHRFLGRDRDVFDVTVCKGTLPLVVVYQKFFVQFCISKLDYVDKFIFCRLFVHKSLRKPLAKLRRFNR